MQFESLAVDLRHWLKDNIERGFDRDTLVQSLRAAGHQPKFARQAVDLALARLRPAPAGDVMVAERPPEPSEAGMVEQARIEEHLAQVRKSFHALHGAVVN